jgi:hypothetical protein
MNEYPWKTFLSLQCMTLQNAHAKMKGVGIMHCDKLERWWNPPRFAGFRRCSSMQIRRRI